MWLQLGAPLIPLLERALDGNWLRQQVISNNIANVDTPKYKRRDVIFEEKLKEVLGNTSTVSLVRTNPRHLAAVPCLDEVQPVITRSYESSWRNDGNNVDIEAEMAQQAANLLNYNLLTRLVTDQLGMLRIAISEGRR
ncbi:MAG: flagellar basal body rod protein FlgB [Bacillota bacterium]|jgi:flagellar basal-body rod protein FlgB|nr:flagellar basal body rod protein FlgB [Bacillota bacterium]